MNAESSPHADPLARALEEAADELTRAHPDFKPRSAGTGSSVPLKWDNLYLHPAVEAQKGLADALARDDSLKTLRHGWLSFVGSGHALDPHVLPTMLVHSVLDGEAAVDVLARVRAFAAKSASGGYFYAALTGARVEARCGLSNGIDLIPWADVPDCPQRQRLERPPIQDSTVAFRPKPNCAIRLQLPERRVLFATAMEDTSLNRPADNDLFAAHERANDVIRAMTVVTQRPISLLAAWPHPTESILREIMGTSMQFGPALNDSSLASFSYDPVAVDSNVIAATFVRLESFPKSGKAAVETAIDRIGAALRWKALADKAIDHRIALEVLLLHDAGGQGELKYRLAIRGAQFLGGDKAARLANFNRLKKAYDLGSKAVHRGFVDASAESDEIIAAATSMSLAIAKKLLETGRFPEWESEYVISDLPIQETE